MSACCRALADQFDAEHVARELASRRRKGLRTTTRLLVELLADEAAHGHGIEGASLLDIGAGIGDVEAALFERGLSHATHVEASTAYSDAARRLADEGGWRDRVRFETCDFVESVDRLSDADLVVLDRVICCYPDMPTLVDRSASRARILYALSAPRDGWPVRVVIGAENAGRRMKGNRFRTFVHRWSEIDARLRGQGLSPMREARTSAWRIVVYRRGSASLNGSGAGQS